MLQGENVVLLAYGAASTGKSYTLQVCWWASALAGALTASCLSIPARERLLLLSNMPLAQACEQPNAAAVLLRSP